jgi:hypothetical protein
MVPTGVETHVSPLNEKLQEIYKTITFGTVSSEDLDDLLPQNVVKAYQVLLSDKVPWIPSKPVKATSNQMWATFTQSTLSPSKRPASPSNSQKGSIA